MRKVDQRRQTGWTLALGVFVLWMVTGCGGGISEQARSQVTYTGSFKKLQQAPAEQLGATVIFGGKIIAMETMDDQTELLVLQFALDASDRPEDSGDSDGRFIIRSRDFLDPALYPKGTLITVVGQVAGSEERLIGKMAYRYPVIAPLEMKKWSPRKNTTPRFHIGIGVGTTF